MEKNADTVSALTGTLTRKRRSARGRVPSSYAMNLQNGELQLGEGRDTESVLVAATLANRQLQVSRSTSAYYEKANKDLVQENQRLENELEQKEQDASVVTKAFEERLEAAKCDNAKLCEDVSAARELAQRNVTETMSAMQETMEERDYHLLSLQQRIDWLEEELESVDAFKQDRDTHRREMETLQKAYAEEQERHELDSRNFRMQLMEERVRIRAEQELLFKRHEEDVRKLAMGLLSQKTREVDEENQQLLDEKIFLSEDAKAAREQAETFQRENRELRRNASLAKTAEVEYTAMAARQQREIKQLREQIKTTEESLNTVVEDYENRLQKQAKKHSAALRRLTQERDAAVCSAERFRRDLIKLRALSQQMVERRTELEMFFYDALAQVRREMLEERRRGTHSVGYQQIGSSSLQPITPRLKKGEAELLMISDRGVRPSLMPQSQLGGGGGGLHTSLKNKEMAFGDGSLGGTTSLPLVALPKGELSITHNNRLIPAKEWHYSENGALSTRFPTFAEEPLFAHSDLSRVPSAPKLKDLKSIEISQLSWKDKERVLQILFKQLQGKSDSSKAKQRTPTEDVEFLAGGVAVNPETHTFLTE